MRSASASAVRPGWSPSPCSSSTVTSPGRVDLRPRDDPRGAVLVPDPHVFHLDVEERIARLRHHLQVELVAEVGRVLREDAIAEQPEDGRVLPLQPKLELRLELVQFVEVAQRSLAGAGCGRDAPRLASTQRLMRRSVAPRAGRPPCRDRVRRAPARARAGARGRTPARAGGGAESSAPARPARRHRTGADRGRSSAARIGGPPGAAELALDCEQDVEQSAGVERGDQSGSAR